MHGGVGLVELITPAAATVGGVVTGRAGRLYFVTNRHFTDAGDRSSKLTKSTGTSKVDRFPLYPMTGPPTALSYDRKTVVAKVDPNTTVVKSGIDIALIEPLVPVSFEILGVGIPTGHTAPRDGMQVTVSGMQGIGRGVIDDPSSSGTILKKSFFVRPTSGSFQPGQSGAFIVETRSRKVVGLAYGGRAVNGKAWIIAHDASYIASQMGISFTGKAGVFNPSGTPYRAATTTAPRPAPPIEVPTPTPTTPLPFNLSNTTIMIGIGGLVLLVLLTRGR